MKSKAVVILLTGITASWLRAAEPPTAESSFQVTLPPMRQPAALLTNSPFGINTAFSSKTTNREERLESIQNAGIKWGRQDFIWSEVERVKGQYEWQFYDRLVDQCRDHGLLIFGNLAYGPDFYDPTLPEGLEAYCAFAKAAVKRYQGKVDYWQICNEPNTGFWGGRADAYARLLAAAGKAIHETSPQARVLGLNMAFCDILWAEKILKLIPYDCFDIACFHPYRPPCAPEEAYDWWELDQYVKTWHKTDLTPEYPLVKQTFLEQTGELNRVMAKFGPPKPLWVTEICWNTHIHPYGTSELRQADLAVRFHILAIASGKIEKVFWWTLADIGPRQFDQADMVGLTRGDLTPKYAYYAYAGMARRLEGKRWVRNDSFGPDHYAAVFHDDGTDEDLMVAWSTKPYAYLRVNNTEKGLNFYDLFGTRRFVPYNRARTGSFSVPIGESPIYIVGPPGLQASIRPDPGW